jgi:hypothetical protein
MAEPLKPNISLKDLLRPTSSGDNSTEELAKKLFDLAKTDPKKLGDSTKTIDLMAKRNRLYDYFDNYSNISPATKLPVKSDSGLRAAGEAPERLLEPSDQKNIFDFKNLVTPKNPYDAGSFAELKSFLKPQSSNDATPTLQPLREKAWGVVKSASAPSPEIYGGLRKLWRERITEVVRAASKIIAVFLLLLGTAAALIYCSLNVNPDTFIQEFADALATGIVIFLATPFVIRFAQAQRTIVYVRWILLGVALALFVSGYLVGKAKESPNAPLYLSTLRTIFVEMAVACILLAGLELLFRHYIESLEEDLVQAWIQLITAGGRLS